MVYSHFQSNFKKQIIH